MKRIVIVLFCVSIFAMLAGQVPEMIFVKGETFKMGSELGKANEKPVHEVKLSDFYIAKYEVTKRMFLEFLFEYEREDLKKTKRYSRLHKEGDLKIFRSEISPFPDCAINSVNWYLAVDFCNWLSEKNGLNQCYMVDGKNIDCDFASDGYRLPTEAEWEYAAKGGTLSKGFEFSGSDDYTKVAWTKDNSDGIQKVGTKEPNELDIYDMNGNVKEWCWDAYDNDYYKKSPVENPTGPDKKKGNRTIRGGGWMDKAKKCSVTARNSNALFDRDKDLGFRIVKSAVIR